MVAIGFFHKNMAHPGPPARGSREGDCVLADGLVSTRPATLASLAPHFIYFGSRITIISLSQSLSILSNNSRKFIIRITNMQKTKTALILLIAIITCLPNLASAASHVGKIYLQVESHGEAWYVNPTDGLRYYLGRPADAFNIMRELGLGISNANIAKIPVGILAYSGNDNDNDGLPNDLESALGTNPNSADTDNDDIADPTELDELTNPNGSGQISVSQTLVNKFKGRILLQVEQHGEGWYVNPADGRRYFLGRPQNAFEIMYYLGVGISNANLAKIPFNYTKSSQTVPEQYALKYPNDWAVNPNYKEETEFNGLPVIDQREFTLASGVGLMKIFVLEDSKDYTLAKMLIPARKNASLIYVKDAMVGVKPAKKTKFVYNTVVEGKEYTINKGAQFFGDIMISTKKFIHLDLLVFNAKDIATAEQQFNQIMNDIKLQ